MTPALVLEHVSKRFGAVCAVDRLSLEVQPGQLVGFLGPNGAGKSTTLYMIPGLVRPSAGRIRVFGRDVQADYRAAIRPVGIMVETPAFYEYLSARRNLELIARLRGGASPAELEDLLADVGLAERQRDKVGTYSEGMKQRLGIARALLGRPRLLVLDEPTNGLDPEGTADVLTLLRRQVSQQGTTVFLSSHLLHEVEEYCDTVFVVNKGRLAASGSVKEILKPHEHLVRVTFRGQAPPPDALAGGEGILAVQPLGGTAFEFTLASRDSAWLNQFLLARGHSVAAIAPRPRTLKEFFLSTTGENPGA